MGVSVSIWNSTFSPSKTTLKLTGSPDDRHFLKSFLKLLRSREVTVHHFGIDYFPITPPFMCFIPYLPDI